MFAVGLRVASLLRSNTACISGLFALSRSSLPVTTTYRNSLRVKTPFTAWAKIEAVKLYRWL